MAKLADQDTVEAMKTIAQVEIKQLLTHYVDAHIRSEREMEVLTEFADGCMQNIRAIGEVKIGE